MGSRSLEEHGREVASFETVASKRSEELRRANEENYRALFGAIDQGMSIAEVILNDAGEGVDCRIVEANSKFEELIGKTREELLQGKTIRELIPTLDESWSRIEGRVAVTGEPARFEDYAASLDRWIEIYAFRIGDPAQKLVASIYTDITARRRAEQALRNSEKIQKYLLKLSDALRPIASPTEIMHVGPEVLAGELGVCVAGYVEMSEDGDSMVFGGQFNDGRVPELKGSCKFSDFGDGFAPSLARGEEIFIEDVYEDLRGPKGGSEKMRAFKIRSAAGIPLIKRGRLQGFLYATHFETRPWLEWEREIFRQTAERTWAAVERARAEAAQRESEEKYRSLFNLIDQSLIVVEVLYDENGRAHNLRFVETNPAFMKWTGFTDAVGKTSQELMPYLEDECIQNYAGVVSTGEPIRFEHRAYDGERWLDIFASRAGGEGSHLVSILFDDITDRKRTQDALRASEDKQAYKLKLSDATRALMDPIELLGTAIQMLGEKLGGNRVFYAEVDEGLGEIVVERDFAREGTPSMVGRYPLAVFAWIRASAPLDRSTPAVVGDVRMTSLIPEEGRAAVAALRIGSFIAIPLIKDGHLVAFLCVTDASPRAWTSDEAELVWHTAERTWAAVQRARAEAALRESEERYRTLFDSIDQGYALLEVAYDAAGKAKDLYFVETNHVFEKQTGMTNYAGKTARQLNPYLEDRWVKTYAGVVETGESARFDTYVKEIDRWFTVAASKVGGDESRLVSVVFDDITQRKRDEESLRESQERQAYLLKLSDALRPLLDLTEVQGRATQILGLQLRADRTLYAEIDSAMGEVVVVRDYVRGGAPSLVGRYPMEAFAWIRPMARMSRPTVVNDVKKAPFIPDAVRGMILDASVGAFIAVPLRKDGRLVAALCVCEVEPRQWTATEVKLVQETAERTWVSIARAKAEAALRESEERFRLFLENVNEYAFMQCDMEQRITSWNPGAERIFGYSSREILGKPFSLLLSPEDRAGSVLKQELLIAEKGGRSEDALWLIHKDGKRRWTRWVTEPIRNKNGHVTALAKVLRDETERLKTETSLRQSEKLAVVGRMASSIAHEINNPLEAVTNLIYLARRGVVSPEVGEFLEQAERELARVNHISKATLHFHRHTAEPVVADIEEILESVMLLHEGRLRSAGVTTVRRYGQHPSITCQENEIRQVLANLVGNAIDAMQKNCDPRRLLVRVRTVVDAKTGEEGVRVMISDTGSGIKELARNHVFEPFFTTKTATGTGLGLWISAEAVKKHQGTLRFRSRTSGQYRGTVFSVFLKAGMQ